MENISEHITYKEATHTDVRMDNTPGPEQLEAMRNVATRVVEPVRAWLNGPVRVNSFFRSTEVNAAIGGSRTSQHCTGEAVDLDMPLDSARGDRPQVVTNKDLFNYIRLRMEFDQLIWEFGNDQQPAWVHVSLSLKGHNRKQVLKAYRKPGGGTAYRNYPEA